MSALKRLHRDEDLITEEECRRFAKLSRERRLHAFSLAVDKHQNEVLRMIDLIDWLWIVWDSTENERYVSQYKLLYSI